MTYIDIIHGPLYPQRPKKDPWVTSGLVADPKELFPWLPMDPMLP